MPDFGKTHRRRDILEGVVSAVLITGALMVWLFTEIVWIMPLVTFIIGIINILDNIFPYGRQTFMYSWVSGLSIGTLLVIISSAFGLLLWFTIVCILYFAFKIVMKVLKRLSS